MTAFEDLTPYTFGLPEEGALNVGWLGSSKRFPKAKVADEILARLTWLCLHEPVAQTRGYHLCELCRWKRTNEAHHLLVDGAPPYLLGSHEIRVAGDGVVYAAPNLIVHYMLDHRYKPPDEFLAAAARLPNAQPPGWKIKRLEGG